MPAHSISATAACTASAIVNSAPVRGSSGSPVAACFTAVPTTPYSSCMSTQHLGFRLRFFFFGGATLGGSSASSVVVSPLCSSLLLLLSGSACPPPSSDSCRNRKMRLSSRTPHAA